MRLVGVQPRLPGTQNPGVQHPTFQPPPAQSRGIRIPGNQNPVGHPHQSQPPVIQHAFQLPVSQPFEVQPSGPHPHAVQLSDIQPPDDQPPEIQPGIQPTNFEVASSVTNIGDANDISTNQSNSDNASGRSINSIICCDLQLLVHILGN